MAIRPTLIPALQGTDPQVLRDIKRAADSSSVDFGYLVAQAYQESSLKPDAAATSSTATGLYQFTEGTWLREFQKYGAQYGYGSLASAITLDDAGGAHVANVATRQQILDLRRDPALSAVMAAELAKENRSALQSSLGREVNHTELYLAHFLGAAGATKFLSAVTGDPGAKAAELLPAAAAANPGVFYDPSGKARTVGDIYRQFAAKIDGNAQSFAAALPTDGAGASGRTTMARLALQATGIGSGFGVGSLGLLSEPRERSSFAQRALDQLALAALTVLDDKRKRKQGPDGGTAAAQSTAVPPLALVKPQKSDLGSV
jgi:hypothetical protein